MGSAASVHRRWWRVLAWKTPLLKISITKMPFTLRRENPNAKPQRSPNTQSKTTDVFEDWCLGILWGLEIGIWGLSPLYPTHRLVRQFIESGHCHFEMLLLGVLDLVVTDPVQTLHKHHHGGNTGARDLGRIVQRPGGHSMRFSPGFAD